MEDTHKYTYTILASLDKLHKSVYNVAVQCTINDALADRSVTQLERRLLSLRQEKQWLERQHSRVEAQQLESEAQWTENWNKLQTLEREYKEKVTETKQLEVGVV